MGASKELFNDVREQVASPTKKSLFNIRQDHLSLLAEIEDADGLLTPELEDRLRLSEDDFKGKAVSYAFAIKQLDGEVDTIAKEIKRLQARKVAAEKRTDLLREAILSSMQQFGIDKVQDELITISVRKSHPVELSESAADFVEKFLAVKVSIRPEMVEDAAAAGFTESELSTIDVKAAVSKSRVTDLLKEGCTLTWASFASKNNLQIK